MFVRPDVRVAWRRLRCHSASENADFHANI
jgi:hypothetical protein